MIPAPQWLIDLIKPRAAEASRSLHVDYTGRDGHAYALTAVRGELARMSSAIPGRRNETAFAVACRLVELSIADWARLDYQEIQNAYLIACAVANVDGEFLESEAWRCWFHAEAKVTEPAALPVAEHLGTRVPWVDASAGSPFVSAGESPGQAETAEEEFERLVAYEMKRIRTRDEASRRLRAARDATNPLQILSRADQLAIPRTPPLVAGWLGRGQVARIYGPPGAGKSFLAVDLAACVSVGRPWHGRAVARAEVLYFAAEDATGVAMRLQAWERYREIEHNVHLVATPLRLDADAVDRIMTAIESYFEDREIGLIVLDTQAMVTVGMDENSAADMGLFVEAVKLLAQRCKATVLTVHHSGVRGGRARGSSSILGAMDVEMEASISGTTVTLSAVKQKNIAKAPPLLATLNVVDMEQRDDLGQPITSCVLISGEDQTGPFTSPASPPMPALHRRALAIAAVLMETSATGETYSRVRTRAAEVTDFGRTAGTVTATFSNAWALLVERGRVAKAAGREAYYFIEIEGLDRLAHNPDKTVSGGPEPYTPMS